MPQPCGVNDFLSIHPQYLRPSPYIISDFLLGKSQMLMVCDLDQSLRFLINILPILGTEFTITPSNLYRPSLLVSLPFPSALPYFICPQYLICSWKSSTTPQPSGTLLNYPQYRYFSGSNMIPFPYGNPLFQSPMQYLSRLHNFFFLEKPFKS